MNLLRARIFAWLVLAGLVFSSPLLADVHDSPKAAQDFNAFVPGARELEGRIVAPCCWTQTIDIHGSEISSTLRTEIRSRLQKGEPPDAIERSLVERYGAKVLAVPPGSRLGGAGVLIALVLCVGGIGAAVLLRRWQRRSPRAVPKSDEKPTASAASAELDARLDAELARLDRD